jgi:hypothetical protein
MYDESLENRMIEKPRLCINHVVARDGGFLFALTVASQVARQHNMNWDKIRAEALEAGAVEGRKVLDRYFTVI